MLLQQLVYMKIDICSQNVGDRIRMNGKGIVSIVDEFLHLQQISCNFIVDCFVENFGYVRRHLQQTCYNSRYVSHVSEIACNIVHCLKVGVM